MDTQKRIQILTALSELLNENCLASHQVTNEYHIVFIRKETEEMIKISDRITLLLYSELGMPDKDGPAKAS